MEYLKIRRSKGQIRADGSPYAVPQLITKSKKYGKVTSQQTISIKKSIFITGAHDSGKTRWVTRLHENAKDIWGSKIKAEPLFLDTISPLGSWCDSPGVSKWWNEKQKDLPAEERQPWKKLKQYEKSNALPDYCAETGAVLFIDDAHKLAGRKLQLARECVMASRLWVMSASEEQRLPPNLRPIVMRRKPQIFRLRTETAYDGTPILVWMLLVCCVMAGWWEAAFVLGGLKMFSTGRRAARQD